ncbi:branched-chain amino acid ABC transporter permease [Synergistales bacterium]|nr:branched-chain amino acid ABC transporter permease [Synergistales bacterium]
MSIAMWLTILLNGLCTGSLFGLVSAAFSFQFGALRMMNFAYGAFVMVGMYAMYLGVHVVGVDILTIIPLLLVFYFFLGYALRATLLKSSDPNVQIIITSGVALLLESLILFIAGAMPRNILNSIPPTWKIPLDGGMVIISQLNVLTLIVSTAVLVGFAIFLKRTWLGMSIRAVVQQSEAASLMGVDSAKIVSIGFGISFIITSISSVMISLQFILEPTSGHYYQLIGFLVCVIAGMGNLKGGFYAGLLVGLISAMANTFMAQWHDAIIFILFVLILTCRPNGVFVSKKSISRSV